MKYKYTKKYNVWYLVRIRAVKNCFKIEIEAEDPNHAIELVRNKVFNETGHDVLEATTVDPYNWRTRAWTNQVILNRTYDSLPPKKDS